MFSLQLLHVDIKSVCAHARSDPSAHFTDTGSVLFSRSSSVLWYNIKAHSFIICNKGEPHTFPCTESLKPKQLLTPNINGKHSENTGLNTASNGRVLLCGCENCSPLLGFCKTATKGIVELR